MRFVFSSFTLPIAKCETRELISQQGQKDLGEARRDEKRLETTDRCPKEVILRVVRESSKASGGQQMVEQKDG